MFKKISLRWRLTMMTAVLITVVCIGLTVVLNFSAYRLAEKIESAIITTPAQTGDGTDYFEQGIMPVVPSVSSEEQKTLAKQSFRYESVIFTIMAVLIGSALTYYVAGRTLIPVKTLSKKVKNVHIHNLSETIDVPETNDEIAELTQSFNEMTDKLNDAFLMQQRFSASAAHELRTPLAVLQTKIDVFNKKDQHTKEEYETLVSDVKKQTTRLRGLVSDLLDMTVIDNTLEENFMLNDLIEDIVDELSTIAKNKNITLSFRCNDVSVIGNVELLHRAFYNLIENSIKYNVPNGKVEITAYKSNNDKTTIFIKDTGIGIPDEMKNQIFEPFFRVDKSRSREMGGAGLGLSMVDTIIKKHNGSICVTDNTNGGSCFKIML